MSSRPQRNACPISDADLTNVKAGGSVVACLGTSYDAQRTGASAGTYVAPRSARAARTPRATDQAGIVTPELLLPRVAQGDAAAVKACIQRFGGLIWSLARRMTRNDAEAEDAVQEIFVEIWQSAGRYDVNVASETAFVAMIARRRLIDRRRKADRRPGEQALPDGVFGEPERADASEVVEEAGIASAALEKLSPEQQRVLRLSIFQGLSHEKIARSTGLPLGTVKTHARRGLIRIREMLEAERQGEAAGDAPTGQPSEDQNQSSANLGGTV